MMQKLIMWILGLALLSGCSGLKVTRLDPPHLPSPGASPVLVSDKPGVRYYLPHPLAVISAVDQFRGNTLVNRIITVDVQLLPDPAHYYSIDLAQSLFTDDSFTVTLGPGQMLASVDVTRTSQLVEAAKFGVELAAKTRAGLASVDPGVPEACKMIPKKPPIPTGGPELWLDKIDKSLDDLLKSARTDPDSMKVLQSLLDAKMKVEPLATPVEKREVMHQRKVVFLAKGMKPEKVIEQFAKTQCWSAVVIAEPLEATKQ